MSKGMWTKHFDPNNGKVFYFNAAQNKSVWGVPTDGVIHEAPFLQWEPGSGSDNAQGVNELSESSSHVSGNTKSAIDAFETTSTLSAANQQSSSSVAYGSDVVHVPHVSQTYASKNDTMASELQAKIDFLLQQQRDSAILKKQQQKKNNSQQDDNHQGTTTKDVASSYLKQKSELETMAGNKNDDGAKWYVR